MGMRRRRWKKMKERIVKLFREKKGRSNLEKGWWDEECIEDKRKVRRELRKWRREAEKEEK